MDKRKVLLHLTESKDLSLLSASLKAYLIDKDAKLEFLIDGESKDKVLFKGYEGLREFDGREDYDFEIIKDPKVSESRLSYVIHIKDDTRAYLLILIKYDESLIKKALKYVAKTFQQNNIRAVMLSDEFPIDNEKLIAKRASQKDIFQIHEPLLIISARDFALLKDHFDAFTALFFEEKEKKKSFISEIGSYFTKNYSRSNKLPNLLNSFSFYELLLEREKPTFHLLRDGDSNDYHYLFSTIEQFQG